MSDVGIGSALREAREQQGRELSEAAAATSMRVAQLEALEDDRWERFGGDVYAKGFLKSYAVWLGVDPEPLLERYRRYVQHDAMDPAALTAGPITNEGRSEVPAWLLRFGAALGVIALALGLVNLVQDRAPAPAEPDLGAAPDPVPTATPDPEATPSPEPSPEPSPSPTFEGVVLTLAFEENSWVTIMIDGRESPLGGRVFEEGEVLDLEGDDEVIVRMGNAGGVTGLLNGERVGPFGQTGDVLEFRFTDEGFEEV